MSKTIDPEAELRDLCEDIADARFGLTFDELPGWRRAKIREEAAQFIADLHEVSNE